MRTPVIIVLLGAAIGGFLVAAHSGSLYFTGKDWYENCWTKANSDILAKPKSAEQSAAWWQCESSTTA